MNYVKKLLKNWVYTEIQAPVAVGKFLIHQTHTVMSKNKKNKKIGGIFHYKSGIEQAQTVKMQELK